ncbi:dynactin subunit 6-like [Amphiura filiformis]|uniref:dynactin subunit 6-like n=1 Tax=Amphiura filiformis TaxID=82378 RepID=UPI003B214E7B
MAFVKPSVKIGTGAVVCVEAELRGDITVGARTVVHPKARIIAEAGPIVIGESNLIEEQVLIINSKEDDNREGGQTMIIGANNVFEVGCRCEALRVGDNNIIEAKAVVGRETQLSNGNVVGAFCEVTGNEGLPENTVIYGDNCSRRIQAERPPAQTLQLDFLMKILPNYHHLKKSTRSKVTADK